MIYLGDTMASRMERYYNEKSKTTRRSQRNQRLYEQMDDFLDNQSRGLETTRIERLFESYDEYKNQAKRSKSYEIEKKENNFFNEDEEVYHMLKTMNQNTEQHLQKTRIPKGITNEEDKKIRDLISTITNTSYLSKREYQNRKSSIVNDPYETKKEENPKRNIEYLLDQAKFLVQKKRNEMKLKEMDQLLYPYDEAKREQVRKLQLKIKYGSGILFIIFSFIILLLIMNTIR